MSGERPRETVRELVRIVGYTLGAALILGMYLIVPVLLALQGHVPALGTRMLIAVALLVVVEVPVVAILVRTASPHSPGRRRGHECR